MPKRTPLARRGLLCVLLLSLSAPVHAREMTKIYDDLLYPEGPVFDGKNLLFADMLRGAILRYEPRSVAPVFSDESCGPTSLARLPSGQWLAACHLAHEIVFFELRVARRPYLVARERLHRPNDMSAGAVGIYVSESGEFDPRAPVSGKVWLVQKHGVKRVVAEDLHYANGVAVTPDGRFLLVSEHLARRVWRYPIDADGSLGVRTLAFAFASSLGQGEALTGPDGIEPARDGSFYVAVNGRAMVVHVSMSGNLLETFETSGYAYTTNVVLTPDETGLYAVANRRSPRPGGALFYVKLSD
ncbi:MAG: SMP-30/gluconolactonase/LRE family protein [Alphaproteobacteria bacterium]